MKETLTFFRLRTRKYCINVGVPRRANMKRTFTTCSNNITGKYHCPRCDKIYSGKSGLQMHYQKHLGNYNYWCGECARGFAVKCHYEAHVAKHEGRTFPCDLCEKRFKVKSSLQVHYREQHISPFVLPK